MFEGLAHPLECAEQFWYDLMLKESIDSVRAMEISWNSEHELFPVLSEESLESNRLELDHDFVFHLDLINDKTSQSWILAKAKASSKLIKYARPS